MSLRIALMAPLAFVFLAAPAVAEKLSLDVLSAYLNSIVTAQATFTQVNADETISTGRIFIQRPGRMRFEYDPPDESLVLTSGGIVAIFDTKSNQPPEQYPLSRTPLSLILEADINFANPGMVVAHEDVQAATQVTAQDPENPQFGTIALMFTQDPLALRQWVITDDLGQKTTVILGDLQTGLEFAPSQFAIESEMQRRSISP